MKYLPGILLIVTMFACQPNMKSTVNELFEVDKKFSAMSEKSGYDKAFIEFAHPDAVLLRENSLPVKGKPAIAKLFEGANTDGVSFSWSPLDGDIAQSGVLGYTYGTFQIKKDTVIESGTYVSIWKKDENGTWKYVLDSGNQGTGQ